MSEWERESCVFVIVDWWLCFRYLLLLLSDCGYHFRTKKQQRQQQQQAMSKKKRILNNFVCDSFFSSLFYFFYSFNIYCVFFLFISISWSVGRSVGWSFICLGQIKTGLSCIGVCVCVYFYRFVMSCHVIVWCVIFFSCFYFVSLVNQENCSSFFCVCVIIFYYCRFYYYYYYFSPFDPKNRIILFHSVCRSISILFSNIYIRRHME